MRTSRRLSLLCGAWFICAVYSLAFAAPASPDELHYEQKLGNPLPLDEPFTNAEGKVAPLRAAFSHNRPAVLVFGYFNCPQLCSVVASGVTASLREIEPTVGRDFDLIYLSIDPTDTPTEAARRSESESSRYGRSREGQGGWHYLVGTKPAIERVAQAAGFHFAYDEKTRQYAHPSGFVVLTPTGIVSRYFLGVDFAPKDVASAIRRAAEGKVGDSVFDLLLLCFHGDGITGRYGKIIWRVLEASVILTVLALSLGIGWMLREERRRAAAEQLEEELVP